MIRQCSLFLSTALLAATHTSVIAADDPFVEQNGRLVVEVEAQTAEGDWSVQDSIANYTGSGYLLWQGTNNYAKSEAPRGNPIEYGFTITTPGNYELRWRSRNTVSLDATEHNDSWVRFPTSRNIEGEHFLDGWTKAYMGQVAQWTWDVYTVDNDNKPIRQYFDAGEHIIEIAGRSNGHAVDRFALFRYELEDFNTAEFDVLSPSPRTSQLQQASHPYAGNSCVAGTLSLAALDVLSATPPAGGQEDKQAIFVRSAPDYAFLKFGLPRDSNGTDAVLQLASSAVTDLELSVYLASHSDWNKSSSMQALPSPSTLLGTIKGASAKGSITSLNIDSSMLSDDQLTLILMAEPGQMQSVYGAGSRLEPRLNFQFTDEFCANYNLKETGEDDLESGGQTQDTTDDNLVAPPAPPVAPLAPVAPPAPTAGGGDESDANEANANEQGAAVDTGSSIGNLQDNGTGEVSHEAPGMIESDTIDNNVSKKKSLFGGSLSSGSVLLLAAFAMLGCTRRRRFI